MDQNTAQRKEKEPRKRKKISQSYLENAGAYYLERFAASISQFRKVMERKITNSCRDHPDQSKESCLEILETVIRKFENLGYLNDTVYARNLVSSLERRGFSRLRILGTLRNKGIDGDVVAAIVPQDFGEMDKQAALRWAKKKRLGPFCLTPRENDRQRGLASLARAGFSYDTALWVMDLSPDDDAISGLI